MFVFLRKIFDLISENSNNGIWMWKTQLSNSGKVTDVWGGGGGSIAGNPQSDLYSPVLNEE